MNGSPLLLIPIILLFIGGFYVLLRQGIQEWKKTDQEIVSDYLILAASLFGDQKTATKTLVTRFLSTVAFVVFVVCEFRHRDSSPIPYILCGVSLLISGFPLLRALLGWKRNPSDEQMYREAALIAVIIGLVTCGFFCFFMGIGTWHGVWWFVCPPGLIFLYNSARPLVAGLRILFRREKDPGEKHINKRNAPDPWDRPDRKL